jgi:hypothetical protein
MHNHQKPNGLLDGEEAGEIFDGSSAFVMAALELIVSEWIAIDPAYMAMPMIRRISIICLRLC